MAKLSYKVSYYVLYALLAIILVVLGFFFFGGDAQGECSIMSVDSEMWQPANTDTAFLGVRFVGYRYRSYCGCFLVPIRNRIER